MTSDYIQVFILSLLKFPKRLQNVAVNYLLMLMLDIDRHSMKAASDLSGLSVSQFSRFLGEHRDLAISSLETLSFGAAREVSQKILPLCPKSPWKIAIVIDATIHSRSSIHVENSQRFNHGQGFKVGHQWTNILLVINGRDIPLPPISFYTRKECERRKINYKTAIERVQERLESLELSKYVGRYYPDEVVVLMDGGYDSKKIENCILERGWDFIVSLKSSRGVRSSVTKDKSWRSVSDMFWSTRKQSPWKTVRYKRDGKRRRKGIRARKLTGYLKGVKGREIALVCSEKSKGEGRRYLGCSRASVCTSMVLQLYKIRWRVEIFHRDVKGLFGLEDVAGKNFDAVEAHVHWVYCVYILMSMFNLEGGLTAKRNAVSKVLRSNPSRSLGRKIQSLQGQFGGREKIKDLVAAVVRGDVAA
jgi:Transposase DDE domain